MSNSCWEPIMPADGARYSITGLGAQGDGVADTPAGPMHVAGALPGETIIAGPGTLIRIDGPPSPERRTDLLCPHYPRCGGCTVQHMAPELYHSWKQGLLGRALAQRGIDVPAIDLIPIADNTRRRATLSAAQDGGELKLGFHGPASHRIEPIRDCAVLVPEIMRALPMLKAIAHEVISRDGEVRFTVLAAGNGLDLDMVTPGKRALNAKSRARIAELAPRSRILRVTLDGELIYAAERPMMTLAGVKVEPPPGAFVQAVAEAETAMVAEARAGIGRARRVVDLFAGLGTFTFGLASRARVLAVEHDRQLLAALADAARHASGLKPIETKPRDLFLDPLSPRELDAFDAVVFDPPRAGAKAQAQAIARSKVPTVVAVSCNPATLARDLRTLIDGGYRVQRIVGFDQFKYSHHVEAVVVLNR